MANILNKSNHPVLIKKIKLHIWSLRDELEEAIAQRLAESGSSNPNLDDIKEFYSRPPASTENDEDDDDNEDENDDIEAVAEDLFASSDDESEGDGEEEASPEQSEADENVEAADSEEGALEEADINATMADAAQEASDEGNSEEDASEAGESIEEAALTPEADESKPTLSYKRVYPKGDKLSTGYALMSDLNMETFLVFSRSGFYCGQTIVIELLIPQKFSVTAEVVRCEDISRTSRIISDSKANFRIQCVLTYNQPGERSALRNFLQSVEPEIPPPPKKVKRAVESDDDDEFEDLGF